MTSDTAPAGGPVPADAGEPVDGGYVRRLLEVFDAAPERVAVRWSGGDVTAAELARSVRSAARVMVRHGVCAGGAARPGPGGRPVVGVLTVTNSPANLVLRYAANLVGATALHLHTANAVDPRSRFTDDDLLELLSRSDVALLAVDADHAGTARRLCRRLPAPPLLAAHGGGPGLLDLADADPDAVGAGTGTGADTGTDTGAGPLDEGLAVGLAEEAGIVTYTSGSTGRPKGVTSAFRLRGLAIAAGLASEIRSVCLVTLPLSHMSGVMADGALASGGTVLLHQGFEPGEVLRAVEAHRVTRMTISPPQLYRLLDHPDVGTTDLSSLRVVTYLGCPASPERLERAVRVFGPVLQQTYGTSEAGTVTRLSPEEHLVPELLSTVGRPTVARIAVLGPDGRPVPAGEAGEICVRSPHAMLGYWADPALTARVVRDGWLHTGDLGRFDDRGYLHVHGRIADVIKTNGIRIHPEAVERALLGHPGVAQAAVFGIVAEDRTERARAAVVPHPGARLTADELARHLRAELTPEHVPAVITFHPELPLGPTGKPDRAALRAPGAATPSR
ncbi:long-chain fatty acid--CoA ligase [Kitasatospora sp. RG8]|uniref:class I adenylate-forming enzyme family protein n=1 Tax=Kitasatospora sp. RG8 TaxID=2820815 RepID=UPI001ADF72BF|nr:fatty acid--CoA ligase family protein [Kitasatospora sp. RG8]MBP0452927.1 long-chain fatty acid--CoA ligase [Kitasatospora sp. RG8]